MEVLATLLTWLVIGVCAGYLTTFLMDSRRSSSANDVMDGSILGMVAAFLCGFVQSLLMPTTFAHTGFNVVSMLLTGIGTMTLLFLVKRAMGHRHRALS
jgi:uncharacterized membrane protein YeaQ/YmgE (transglycosylase-associated protein family)